MPAASITPAFAAALERFGPRSAGKTATLTEANAYCRRLAGGHYENFPVLSFALPRNLRQHFANVYAFCRWADDLGDEIQSPAESLRLLDWWQRETDGCFRGEAWHPVFVSLRETVTQFSLTQQPFDDLISAFQQDQTQSTFETFEDLRDYCRRSANPVGRIILGLCRRTSDEGVRLSDDVCTGLQLINFWQDVARDAEMGRHYLPQEDRERFGYSVEDWTARRTTPEFKQLMHFEVERARALLQNGRPLVACMPGRLKLVIGLFALGGLKICDRVAALDYDVWRERPKLRKSDLPSLAISALGWAAGGDRSRRATAQ